MGTDRPLDPAIANTLSGRGLDRRYSVRCRGELLLVRSGSVPAMRDIRSAR